MRTDWSYFDPDFEEGGQTIDERLDRLERHDRLRLRYHLRARTDVTLDAQTTGLDFDNPTVEGRSKDSRGWSLRPGVDFGEGGVLSGTARFGFGRVDSEDPDLTDFSGLVANAELAYRPNPRATLTLAAVREPGLTVTGTSIYYVETRYRLRAVYYWNRVFGVEAGTSQGGLTFPGGGSSAERQDDILEYDGGIRLRLAENSLGRRVEYALRLGRYRRDSTSDELDLSRNTFGLTAVVGF
jgi:hypothetical protein